MLYMLLTWPYMYVFSQFWINAMQYCKSPSILDTHYLVPFANWELPYPSTSGENY